MSFSKTKFPSYNLMSMRILLVTASLLLALCSTGFAMVPTTVIRQDTPLQDTLNNDILRVLDMKSAHVQRVGVVTLTQPITQDASNPAEVQGVFSEEGVKAHAPGVFMQESTCVPGG